MSSLTASLSHLAPALAAVGLDPDTTRLQIADAGHIAGQHAAHLDVDAPAVLLAARPDQAAALGRSVRAVYPADHPVQWLAVTDDTARVAWRGPLADLDAVSLPSDPAGVLFIPALPYPGALTTLQGVMATLLSPQGCPWDREQTHLTLRKYLLEETYEVLATLDAGDLAKLPEELGDLLLQVVFHSQIAARDGEFHLADVVHSITSKLIRRHPHVFGDTDVRDAEEVTRNWERLKAEERARAGQRAADPFAGISLALPALSRAQELQRRATRFGFAWPDRAGAWAKFEEEMAEWQTAASEDDRRRELGDLLFALANVAQWDAVDVESALREANTRFAERFTRLLAECEARGEDPRHLPPGEMLARWRALAVAS